MNRRYWPAALALLSLGILGSYLLYTEHLVREIRVEAAVHMRMYALVQRGLLSPEEDAPLESLVGLQDALKELGVPIVALSADGQPFAWVNLPFQADLPRAADRERVLRYARRLDRQNPPIVQPGVGTIHFGAPPVLGWLRWVPWLQVAGALLVLLGAGALVRVNLRAERERLWAAMARELAHQMGTPLSSLAGWVELLRLPEAQREGMAGAERIAEEIERDVERLERVSRRFEMIGKAPRLEPVPVAEVLAEVEHYLRPRLPRLVGGLELRVRVQRGLPPVRASRVLLVWALENLVKNALDAVGGRGGRILLAASRVGQERVRLAVADTGPGVAPAMRDRLFDPGATTKAGGWGVGLSLSRRIVERYHGGRITVRARRRGGTVFEVVLPAWRERDSRGRVFRNP
ncbi:MAG: HAMP domain-containing histidine kinase [Gemmatimonadetes bacterium]|nr:HAMP domain-containing histidine kinase [Gemmatimonadota bacterium]